MFLETEVYPYTQAAEVKVFGVIKNEAGVIGIL